MPELDTRHQFYLGRDHDLAAGRTGDAPLLYESKDLTTHAVCVGMTGSGKTGLCLSLLEEAALDGVPAIAIDPKGDLGNLLLGFPNLAADDFRPWVDASVATRKGVSVDQLAEETASLWRKGLESWGEGPERIQRYNDAVERVIYTPGSSSGVPLTVLDSFHAPPAQIRDDVDAYRERTSSAVSGLLGLLGVDADPVRSREHIFLSNVLDSAWREGRDLDIQAMIRSIMAPPFTSVGVMDLETFFPQKDRTALAMNLNNLLASPSFAGWMQGAPLDVQSLLYNAAGKPRHSIISIAHLDDAQRMFFVTILLNEVVAWMRQQPGTGSLRAILYMDEVYGYFPPVANPPSKLPMLTLLKQARAFGVGCVLATQNPVDVDYKGLSNAGTWFLGRLQTERDKARVIEGLEGASAEAGAKFDRGRMEATLAALGSRVFLMNNVHEDAPRVFHTRWALSFLAGPLTRSQIKTLMDPVRDRFHKPAAPAAGGGPNGAGQAAPVSPPPVLAQVKQRWLEVNTRLPKDARLEYRPGLLGSAKLHYVKASDNVDAWRELWVLKSFNEDLPDALWSGAMLLPGSPKLLDSAEYEAPHAPLPPGLTVEKNYSGYQTDLRDHLYQTERLTLWRCPALGATSGGDEDEASFRERLKPQAAAWAVQRRAEVEKSFERRLAAAKGAIDKAQKRVDAERSRFWGRLVNFLGVALDLVLRVVQGKATTRARGSTITQARGLALERSGSGEAQRQLDEALAEAERLATQLADELALVDRQATPAGLVLEPVEVAPRKGDIDVASASLVWLPFELDAAGRAVPLY